MVLTIAILIFLLKAGVPAIFSLAQIISQVGRKPSISQSNNSPLPNTPIFSQDLIATFSANIKITGAADPKTTVEIIQNDRSLGTVITKDDGSFIQDVSLEKNDNSFTATAISETGQKSPPSFAYIIKYLSGQPKLELDSPKDNVITGKTDAGNTITVNDRLVIVNSDGSFSYTPTLSNGDNKFIIVSTDQAGNKATKEVSIKQ